MAQLEDLCQRCGLCCDGTLFNRVPIGVSEQVPEAALHVIKGPNGGRFIPQCCAALEGTSCTVYAQRPLACRKYECLLFGAVREGEVSFAEALEVIQRVKQRHIENDPKLDELITFHFGRRN